MHVEPETLPEEQLKDGVNLVDLSRTLLRIVAGLPENEYSDDVTMDRRRQAEVQQHSDPADPASEERTSQG